MDFESQFIQVPVQVRVRLDRARRAARASQARRVGPLLLATTAGAFAGLRLVGSPGAGALVELPVGQGWVRHVVVVLAAFAGCLGFFAHARAASAVGRAPAAERWVATCEQEFIACAHAALTDRGVTMSERFATPLWIYGPSPRPVELAGWLRGGRPVAVRLVRAPSGPGWAIAVRPGTSTA